MKVQSAKFYQAVSIFDGERYKTVTHVNLTATSSASIAGKMQLSIEPNVGLLVETEFGATVITFNNIAFMTLEKEAKQEKSKAAPKKA